jgi:hypothetical protein
MISRVKTLEIVKRKKTGVTAAMVSMVITTDVEDYKSSRSTVMKRYRIFCYVRFSSCHFFSQASYSKA